MDKTRELLQSADISLISTAWPDGMTGLHVAAQKGFLDIATILVEKNAALNPTDVNHCTPLFYAAQSNQIEMIKYLIGAGANPDIPDKDGRMPIHIAAQHGYTGSVVTLIEHGCMINYITNKGETAVQLAVKAPETVKVLEKYFSNTTVSGVKKTNTAVAAHPSSTKASESKTIQWKNVTQQSMEDVGVDVKRSESQFIKQIASMSDNEVVFNIYLFIDWHLYSKCSI